jgi:hypothetical protein
MPSPALHVMRKFRLTREAAVNNGSADLVTPDAHSEQKLLNESKL